MEINYFLPALSVLVQLFCAYLYIIAYRTDGKKNVLASFILALFAIVTTLLTPYLDSLKAEVTLRKQAETMQAAIAAGTADLNHSNSEMRLAQEETRKSVEALRKSQQEVQVLRSVINNGTMLTNSTMLSKSASATTRGIAVQKAVRSPMLNNTGKISTEGGHVIMGSNGNRITTIGEPIASKTLQDKVSGLTSGKAYVEKGQRVRITAGGSINIGTFAGTSPPEGRPGGFLSAYSIDKTFNHAALLYRIAGEKTWSPYGDNCVFEAQKNGNIEFQINDAEQVNNSGYYLVTTQIYAD